MIKKNIKENNGSYSKRCWVDHLSYNTQDGRNVCIKSSTINFSLLYLINHLNNHRYRYIILLYANPTICKIVLNNKLNKHMEEDNTIMFIILWKSWIHVCFPWPGWVLPYLGIVWRFPCEDPFLFSIRLGSYFIPQHIRIDPLFLQKKIGLSVSHLLLQIIGPKVRLYFHTKSTI